VAGLFFATEAERQLTKHVEIDSSQESAAVMHYRVAVEVSCNQRYHLNAEEEPELPDYPTDPAFKERFGPRGVLHCLATDKDDATNDPRFGKVGKQTILIGRGICPT
jgi:hypothetical protein